MNVKDLVKERQKRDKSEREKWEKKEKTRKRRLLRQEFNAEVARIMSSFEHGVFDIDASEKKVADFIVDYPKGRSLFWDDDYFHRVQLVGGEYSDDIGDINVKTSKKFVDWKKALEDKFNIDIRIYKHYTSERRFGNSGYETYPNRIYHGIRARVYVKGE